MDPRDDARRVVAAYLRELRVEVARALGAAPVHPGVDRIVDELRLHLEESLAERTAGGLSRDEAARAAVEATGTPREVARAYRSAGAPRFIRPEPRPGEGRLSASKEAAMTILREMRHAWRGLARAPGYAAAFVLTLGLGIGANTAIFSVVRGIWLRPLPHTDGERLVYLRQSAALTGIANALFSVPEIDDYRQQVTSFDGVVEFSSLTFTVHGLDQPRRLDAGIVTADYFEVMGLEATLGRLIASSDDGAEAAPVAVLTDEFWRSGFGADPSVVGRVLRMNGRSVEIVGVLEKAPPYPERTDIYLNMVASPHHLGATMTQDRMHRMTEVFARLAAGASLEDARAEVAAVAARLRGEYPEAYDASQGFSVAVTPLREQLASRASRTVLTLLAVTGFVLVIACANVANLTLARVMRRYDELAVRISLGASAWRLRRQLLVESLIPSLLGAGLGCLVAYASVDLLAAYAARYSARAGEIGVDAAVLGAALGLGILAAVLFALVPRLPGESRHVQIRPDAARGAIGAAGRRAQRLLVVSQVAVSCVLLVGAGLLLRTLHNLQSADGGLELEDVLSVEMPAAPRAEPEQRLDYFRTILERAEALPGVESAAFGLRVPLRGVPAGLGARVTAMELEIEGEPPPPGAPLPRGDYRPVSPDYFATVGLRLLRGRLFDDSDRSDSHKVAVVNQAMAEHHFSGRDPVGMRLAWRDDAIRFIGVSDEWRTVVGVVSDSNDYGLAASVPHVIYQPLAQEPAATTLLVRTPQPAAAAPALISAVRALEPDQPIERVATLAEVHEEEIGPQRLNAVLVGGFAALALVIAAIGVGGVLAFGVTERVRELGLRAALGADRRRLLTMVLGEGTALTAVGLLAGWGGALVTARLLTGLLFGVGTTDAFTFAGVAVVMMGVAVAASLAPAWHAANVDPAQALRAD
jgi:predicted permease